MWLLVGVLLLPLASCDVETAVTERVAVALKITLDLPNLRFSDPNWILENWNVYLVQDFIYMNEYQSFVTKNFEKYCPGQVPSELLDPILARLRKVIVVASDYETRYGVKDVLNAKATKDLAEYFQHYMNQGNCYDLISTALPCVCLYPPLAKALSDMYPAVESAYVKNWIKDNQSSGTTCKLMKEALEATAKELKITPFEKSMEYEIKLFSLTTDSPYFVKEEL